MFQPFGADRYQVVYPLTVAITDIDGVEHVVRIPQGYTFDGASIPRVMWSIVGSPFEPDYMLAACVHDWYCEHAKCYFDRVIGDNVFLLLLARTQTVPRLRQVAMYMAVRLYTFFKCRKPHT